MSLWCCEVFESYLQQEGSKGMFISANIIQSYKVFYLNFQVFENEVMQQYFTSNDSDKKITLLEPEGNNFIKSSTFALRLCINYCPFCGANLSKIIIRRQKEFDQLAKFQCQPWLVDSTS